MPPGPHRLSDPSSHQRSVCSEPDLDMEEIREMNRFGDDLQSRPDLQRVNYESYNPAPFACMILPDHKEDNFRIEPPKVIKWGEWLHIYRYPF